MRVSFVLSDMAQERTIGPGQREQGARALAAPGPPFSGRKTAWAGLGSD